jgi:hypothetical protein
VRNGAENLVEAAIVVVKTQLPLDERKRPNNLTKSGGIFIKLAGAEKALARRREE